MDRSFRQRPAVDRETRMRQLFATFFKIGLFTFGGGYAMIPMMESEVVERKRWMSREEFLDLVAMAQSCPGVFAVNISVYTGYKLRRVGGAIAACAGAVVPSFVIILLIAMFFHQFEDNPIVAALFRGLRPAVVALIAVPVFTMAKTAKIMVSNCWIPIVAALLIWMLGVSPILIILVAGIGGFVYGQYIRPTE